MHPEKIGNVMELTDFKAKLKSGDPSGWYIFSGEEDYLKKYYLTQLRNTIVTDGAFALFNHATFDGPEVDFGALRDAISSPPMMSDYKLVEWKFANIEAMKEGEKKALEALFPLREEHPYTIFAIMTTLDGLDVGTQKRPSKLSTRLAVGFDIVNFEKSTDSQLLSWLKKHFDAEGVSVNAPTLQALIFRSGRSMDVLNNEVIKLASYAKANDLTAVTEKEVEEIASPTVECDAFALSNAVIEKNLAKAFTALTDLKARRVEPQVIIAMLERVYADLAAVSLLLAEGKGSSDVETLLKLHPFKAKLYIGAAKKIGARKLALALDSLRHIDASSKSGGMTGYGTVEMFITQNL